MAYKIIDIQGIGPVFAEKLIAAGIDTDEKLLAAGASAKGRKELEEELLEAAGVDTVKELRNRNAANLAAKMLEINEAKHLCKRTPVEKEIQKYIDAAKALEPVVTY